MSASKPRVLNKRLDEIPPEAVYVGRPTKWGNPFPVEKYGRRNAVRLYKIWLHDEGPIADIGELRGKDLVCWCVPNACHAEYLLELANK